MKGALKLYVWPDALEGYFPGVIFAIAHNVTEARKIVRAEQDTPTVHLDTVTQPDVYDLDKASPKAWLRWGGD